MKKRKIIALTLLVAFLCSLCIPGTWAIAGNEDNTPPATENKGMEISKTATPNDDDTYTITLEAYATGEKISTEVTKDVPTDIILVLDQSGSMNDNMSSEEGFHPYAGQNNYSLYDYRFNNRSDRNRNLYYPVGDGYVQVSVDRSGFTTYIEQDSQTTNWDYYQNRSNLYIKGSDGEYQKVTVSRDWQNGTYTYTAEGMSTVESSGWNSAPYFGEYGPVYVYGTDYEFTYYYQLPGQDRVVIETSIGWDTVPEEIYYNRGTVTTSRLEALRGAVANFSNSVAEKAKGPDKVLGTPDDVNHRIAVVGFASQSDYDNNTELLSISGKNSGSVGVAYNNITVQNLKDVLQNMNISSGQTMVGNAIDALVANGATRADLGMDMAMRILNANPVPDGEKRNRVVVFFTDGSPTSSNGFEEDVADAAIEKAKNIKDGGTTVYSVGVFPGADATENGIAADHSQKKENQFMQDVSSNNGTPQTPSYYLSASDSSTLNNIFERISDNIESGGSGTTLDENAVIKDTVSDYFQLPEGTDAGDITVQTVPCTSITNDVPSWGNPEIFNGAQVTVDAETGAVSVSGFDFAENYVGMDKNNGNETLHNPAKKLVISFNVVPKDGFLGGNGVPTNASAGVYKDANATESVFTFPEPATDVEIKQPTVNAPDKNVYLTNGLTANDIKQGVTVMVPYGGSTTSTVDIDLSDTATNYGLETWQNEYVNIFVVYKDANGHSVTDLSNLYEDTTYTAEVTISPKSEGAYTAKTDSATGDINVFKPELTFKDSEVYYGDTVPNDFSDNLVSTVWKHGADEANTEKMGDAPALSMTYTPDSEKTRDGKINSKTVDIPVDVATVKIGDADVTTHTTFQHTNCDGKTCTVPAGKEFLLHPQTCQLTVRKTGGAVGEPYVFDIMKDGTKYSEVTIVGNGSETIYELPVGTYIIQEDTGWSWRYSANNGNSVTLSAEADHHEGTITCTNNKENDKWLNGYSDVVTNICSGSHNN